MLKIACSICAALFIILSPAAIPAATAQTWGCSSEKCMAACLKAGGKNCSGYCDKALREKQQSKVCK